MATGSENNMDDNGTVSNMLNALIISRLVKLCGRIDCSHNRMGWWIFVWRKAIARTDTD